MSYDTDYDSYDPYTSRPMSRAVSRQRSIGYAATYPPTYSDASMSDVSLYCVSLSLP